MKTNPTDSTLIDEYRRQIQRCAHALAVAEHDSVSQFIRGAEPVAQLKLFTDGNLDKRYLKLEDALEFVAEQFPDLESRLVEYVKTVPLMAYDTGTSDTVRFLDWLSQQREFTPEQVDCATCQQSRYHVELLAAKDRMAHVRFQELATRCDDLATQWGVESKLWIHRNPIAVWAQFQTELLLDEDDTPPADVLFFPVGNDIRTAVLEPEAKSIINTLEKQGPCRCGDLLDLLGSWNRAEVIEIGSDLAEIGIVAFG